MTEWIAPDRAPDRTWGWVVWGSCCGGRKVALGARDGAFWRADGYTIGWDMADWEPLKWASLITPDVPDGI